MIRGYTAPINRVAFFLIVIKKMSCGLTVRINDPEKLFQTLNTDVDKLAETVGDDKSLCFDLGNNNLVKVSNWVADGNEKVTFNSFQTQFTCNAGQTLMTCLTPVDPGPSGDGSLLGSSMSGWDWFYDFLTSGYDGRSH